MLRIDDLVYLDSSALVKLVISERESADLTGYLAAQPLRASCALARVEVSRAARLQSDDAMGRAREILSDTYLIALESDILTLAADLVSASLRSLDAIHLAAAISIRARLSALVTYDRQMARAAADLGLRVDSPGRP